MLVTYSTHTIYKITPSALFSNKWSKRPNQSLCVVFRSKHLTGTQVKFIASVIVLKIDVEISRI